MKYPKAWRDAIKEADFDDTISPEKETRVLRALYQVGALKEIPKPREYWVTTGRMRTHDGKMADFLEAFKTKKEAIRDAELMEDTQIIHVREVLDD